MNTIYKVMIIQITMKSIETDIGGTKSYSYRRFLYGIVMS